MDSQYILSVVAIIVSVGGTIIALINHKRLRSKCCGRNMEVSVDIENTTPPKIKPAVEV